MSYITKKSVLKAYECLSHLTEEPTQQGATQRVSAIRHFLALDNCYLARNKNCDLKESAERQDYLKRVGLVCDVCEGKYTPNFYFPLNEHRGDYNVGSNFFSAGQVQASRTNQTEDFIYPKRGNVPLLRIRNEVLIRDESLYENLTRYIENTEQAVALVVWILRKEDIPFRNKGDIKSIHQVLATLFTPKLLEVLVERYEHFYEILSSYIQEWDNVPCEINEEDIKQLFPQLLKLNVSLYTGSTTSLQQIFYGAPGTGKSHRVKEATVGASVVRTTFHPDTDYASFVGAYKPTMESVPLRDLSGHLVKAEDGDTNVFVRKNADYLNEERIVYKFVAQSFLCAYVEAWSKMCAATAEETPQVQYLVIEEINRGNCAQIFGDLFQLLDRGDEGFSEYFIQSDADIERYLRKEFESLSLSCADALNSLFAGKDIASNVLCGKVLLLPPNLRIWATMNTSDQSLFPIDSAFKRRWEWCYTPITDAGMGWEVEADGERYDWWTFLVAVNKEIGSLTSSEDKQLGYFFCKASGGVISAETFVGKVVFYLWNDVFKDYGFEGDLFKSDNDKRLTFSCFYNADAKVCEPTITRFMNNLGVNPKKDESEDEELSDEEGRDQSRYSVDGRGSYKKAELSSEVVKAYSDKNPQLTSEKIIATWSKAIRQPSRFVENEADNASWVAQNPERRAGRSISVTVGSDQAIVCVTKQMRIAYVQAFIDAAASLGITIRKVEE